MSIIGGRIWFPVPLYVSNGLVSIGDIATGGDISNGGYQYGDVIIGIDVTHTPGVNYPDHYPVVAIGAYIDTQAVYSVTIGQYLTVGVDSNDSVVIGSSHTVEPNSQNIIVIGNHFSPGARWSNAVVIGSGSGIAGGAQAGNGTVLIGNFILDNSDHQTAIGIGVTYVYTSNCIALGAVGGANINSGSDNSVCIGPGGGAHIGNNCYESIAIGNTAHIDDNSGGSIVIGNGNNTGIGNGSSGSIVLGTSFVGDSAPNSIVIGLFNQIDSGCYAPISIGRNTHIQSSLTTAIGYSSTIGASSDYSSIFGGGSAIHDFCEGSTTVGYGSVIGDHGDHSFAAGGATIGTAGGTHAQGNIAIGNTSFIADVNHACIIIGGFPGYGSQIATDSSGAIILGAYAAIGTLCGNSILMGWGQRIGDRSDYSVAIRGTIGTDCTAAITIGGQIGNFNARSVALLSSLGDHTNRSIAIGDGTVIGTGGGTHALDNVAVGPNISIPDQTGGDIALGVGINFTNDVVDSTAIGNNLDIHSNNQFVIAMGWFTTVGDHSSAAIAIGPGINYGDHNPHCIALGFGLTLGASSEHNVAIGTSCTIGGGTTDNIVIGNSSSIYGVVNTLLGSNANTGSNGSPVNNTVSVGGYNTITASESIVVGVESSASGTGAMAFGRRASATQNNEVVFGSSDGSGHPVEIFRAVSGTLDLFKFDLATIVNNHDSAMHLLYKDATGTLVLAPVKVDNVTGALTVPL